MADWPIGIDLHFWDWRPLACRWCGSWHEQPNAEAKYEACRIRSKSFQARNAPWAASILRRPLGDLLWDLQDELSVHSQC